MKNVQVQLPDVTVPNKLDWVGLLTVIYQKDINKADTYNYHLETDGVYVNNPLFLLKDEVTVNVNGLIPNVNCFYYKCLTIAEKYPDKQFKITTCLGYGKDHVIEFGYLDRCYYYQIARFNNINDSESWQLWKLDDIKSSEVDFDVLENYTKTVAGNIMRLPEKERLPWYLVPLELLGLLN